MSKVICDICGTVYPDNANVCPICGYPRKDSEKAVEEEAAAAGTAATAAGSAPAKAKGGRFSNKNVKKRNQSPAEGGRRRERRRAEEEEPEEKSNRGLVIAVIVLAVAVLLVGVYIGWRFFDGADAYDNPSAPVIGTNPSEDSADTQPSDTVPEETGIPCVGMTISDASVEFQGAGRGWKLSVMTNPEDTTEELTFRSSDESVVTVSSDGRLTSVGPGTATITITCGQVTRECQVICSFEAETEPEETTEPVETTDPEETTEPEETTKPTENNTDGFELDRSDVTLFAAGETFTFGITFNGQPLSPAKVEWKTKDSSVATVENGKVTAVGPGKTTIVATYNGQERECIIRCRFEETTETTEPTQKEYADSNWKLSDADGDATLIIGESFTLKLTNDAGETADVTWSSSNAGVVSIDGNVITGKIAGYTEVTATIDGKTFTCIVRVIENR